MIKMLFFLILFTFSSNLFAQNSFEILTFNVGLAHSFVSHAKERLPQIIDVLKKDSSDLLCLQEVWKKKDRKKIIKALKIKYPHSYFVKGEQLRANKTPVCKIKELFGDNKFLTCMNKHCSEGDSDQQTTCSRTICGQSLIDLKNSNRQCASVLMGQVGRSTVMAMITLFGPFKKPGLFTYKGENGLLMLSKHKLKNKKFIDWKMRSTLSHRGALYAESEILNRTNRFVCTHLSANLENTVPYAGEFTSWETEQKIQAIDLLKKIKASEAPLFLMGDFNCSFTDIPYGVDGEFENNCSLFKSQGFIDPTSQERLGCTYCNNNLLVGDDDKNVALDHIFIKNARYENSKVVFNQEITIIKDNKEVLTNLSDHFGLKIKVLE